MSSFFFKSFFILVQYIILKLNVSSHPLVHKKDKIFWISTPTNFNYEPPLPAIKYHHSSRSQKLKFPEDIKHKVQLNNI
jgi:hypothetical protein